MWLVVYNARPEGRSAFVHNGFFHENRKRGKIMASTFSGAKSRRWMRIRNDAGASASWLGVALLGAVLALPAAVSGVVGATGKGVDVYAESARPEMATQKIAFESKLHSPGLPLKYSAYLMKDAGTADVPLYVMMEYSETSTLQLLETFAAEGLIPPGLIVFIANDSLRPTVKGGFPRYQRGTLFDKPGRCFPDILVEEVIPAAAAMCKVSVTADPDLHFISGSSAGGGATLNAAWLRNDYFHRCYAISPLPDATLIKLIRFCEAKPLRVYITTGDKEPDRVSGDLFLGNMALRAAFDYAGYPCELTYYPQGGHNAGKGNPAQMRRVFEFVFKDWRTKKIVPERNPIRVSTLVASPGWKESHSAVPPRNVSVAAAGGVYTVSGGKILFAKDGVSTVVADGFRRISGLSLSSDLWRLYVADEDDRYVRVMTVRKDGSLGGPFRHAPVMITDEATRLGACDILTLENDRVLLATELGVQSAMSFGTLDVVLPLPGDLPVDRIWMKGKTLFAASGSRVFERELLVAVAPEGRISEPDKAYYAIPGENRNSSHLDQFAPAFETGQSVVITNRIAR